MTWYYDKEDTRLGKFQRELAEASTKSFCVLPGYTWQLDQMVI